MRRNVLNWFVCGLMFGSVLALTVLAAVAARAAVEAVGEFRAYPLFIAAMVIGGACWLFKRDGVPLRRHTSGCCFISKERKARIEDLA